MARNPYDFWTELKIRFDLQIHLKWFKLISIDLGWFDSIVKNRIQPLGICKYVKEGIISSNILFRWY